MPERRHAAIMFTGIAGYTVLMGRDEDSAFSILRYNHEIHETLIRNYNGVLVKEVGDGTLASFSLASEAVRWKKAIKMLPISLDALQGPYLEHDLIQIYIITGHFELALEKIEFLLSIPSWLSIGELMIDPIYDPLRDLQRFREILEDNNILGMNNPGATNS